MNGIKTTICIIIAILLDLLMWYLWQPPMNFSSPSFWWFVILAVGIVSLAFAIAGYFDDVLLPAGITGAIAGIALIIWLIGACFSGGLFNAKLMSNLLDVETTTFDAEFENVNWDTVPQIDHASSAILGARKMGTLVQEVSQYNVAQNYTLINQNGKPTRVAPLVYASAFKYFNNKYQGIPGYITVDCVEKAAEFVRLEKGIQYSPSACFSKDLNRHLRSLFPGMLFDEFSFEIDDDGVPYWVVPTYTYSCGIGGGKTPNGCIVCDPITGSADFYTMDKIPEWIDHAVDDDTVTKLIKWWGKYQDGWWNSWVGQRNVKQATQGNNFVTIGNDVYLYTGITSVALDESNIGFILVNQRTAEARYFEMPSAEEYSAMDSAKGQVQHLNYTSTFPILINLNGEAVYFLSLKDAAGLVKMYALVSVEDIQKLAVTDSTLGIEYLVEQYSKSSSSIQISGGESKTVTFDIANIYTCVIDGNTQYYFEDANDNVYITDITKSVKLPVYSVGDKVTITYSATNVEKYFSIVTIE